MKFTPTKGRFIGVEDERSKQRLHGTFLALPSRYSTEAATTLMLTDVGDGVNIRRGSMVAVRTPKEGKRTMELRPKTWGMDASEILCVRGTHKDEDGSWQEFWQPVGKRLLVRRLNREVSLSCGLVLPDTCDRVTQSPFSVVLELGTEHTGSIQRGDVVYAPWSMAQTEIGNAGNDYFLTIPANEVEFILGGEYSIPDIDVNPRPRKL
jgi:hypothetical protein